MKYKKFDRDSYHEACVETSRLLDSDPSLSDDDPKLPAHQYWASYRISLLEERSKKDKFFLMKAIALCAKHGLAMPEWVGNSFLDLFYKITAGNIDVNSWDAVLGTPYPPNTQLHPIRKREILRSRVYKEVKRMQEEHPELSKGDYFYEQIARKFATNQTYVKELNKEAMELLGAFEEIGEMLGVEFEVTPRINSSLDRLPLSKRAKKNKHTKE